MVRPARSKKSTAKMCWGTARVGDCSGRCGWRLAPEGEPAAAIFACDAHLPDAIRFMGVPAIVIKTIPSP